MAGTIHLYRWNAATDTIWHVCARFLGDSGYLTLPTFVEQTRAANTTIKDWQAVSDHTTIVLPYIS